MKKRQAHCNLSVVFARQAPVAVILRRGPTLRVQQILWNTADDTFEEGHWFHGRVHANRCDVSPDGNYFIYFATKYSARQGAKPAGCTWTAVSRPPWYTALALWTNGNTTYFGGGAFKDNNTILINQAPQCEGNAPTIVDVDIPKKIKIEYTKIPFGESMEIAAFERSGWKWIKLTDTRAFGCQEIKDGSIREKTSRDNKYKIVALRVDRDDAFEIIDMGNSEAIALDADWADWDQRGRLVFTRRGLLLTADPTSHGVKTPNVLADFSPNQPEEKSSPQTARCW
jgi:hypothetical protein